MSSHPLSSTYPGSDQQLKQRGPDLPLPRYLPQLFWEETKVFPGQPGDVERRASWPDAWTTATGSSWCGGAESLSLMTELLHRSQRRVQPACAESFSRSRSFDHYPQLTTRGAGRSTDWPVNSLVFSFSPLFLCSLCFCPGWVGISCIWFPNCGSLTQQTWVMS